jgi:hypothetical protein
MSVDAEKEITRLWRALHGAQDEIGKTFYRWRQVAIACAGPDVQPLDVGLKAAEAFGREIGKSFLPRLNWLKGEEAFLLSLGRQLADIWVTEGGLATAEKGEKAGEVVIRCTRDPWPSWAKEYGVPMEEVALCRERMFQAILADVSVFFNIPLTIALERAIPRGQGETVMRLRKAA